MKKVDILTSFSRYSNHSLVLKAKLIVTSMTGNSYFATPDPTLADIKAAAEALETAIVEAKEGTKAKILAREDRYALLVKLLTTLALYVKFTAKGNEQALASTGFSLSKKPEPIGVLTKPQNFRIEPNDIGAIKLSVKTIYGANGYQYEYRKKGEVEWNFLMDTKSKVLLTGLESGVQYEFRVTGMGTVAQRVYSDIVSSFIL